MRNEAEEGRRYNNSQKRNESKSYLGTGKISNYQPHHSSYDNETDRSPPKTVREQEAPKYAEIRKIVEKQQKYHQERTAEKVKEEEEKEFQRDDSVTDDITRNNSVRGQDDFERTPDGPYVTQKASKMD